jgi:hypothetical protein
MNEPLESTNQAPESLQAETAQKLGESAFVASRKSRFSYEKLMEHRVTKLILAVIHDREMFGIPKNDPINQKTIQETFSDILAPTTIGYRLHDLLAEGVLERIRGQGYSLSLAGKALLEGDYKEQVTREVLRVKVSLHSKATDAQKSASAQQTGTGGTLSVAKSIDIASSQLKQDKPALTILAILSDPLRYGITEGEIISQIRLAAVFPGVLKRSLIQNRMEILSKSLLLERSSSGHYTLTEYGRAMFQSDFKPEAEKAAEQAQKRTEAKAASELPSLLKAQILEEVEKSNPALFAVYQKLSRNPVREAVLLKGIEVSLTDVRGSARKNPIASALTLKTRELTRHFQGLFENKLLDHRERPTELAKEWKALYLKLHPTAETQTQQPQIASTEGQDTPNQEPQTNEKSPRRPRQKRVRENDVKQGEQTPPVTEPISPALSTEIPTEVTPSVAANQEFDSKGSQIGPADDRSKILEYTRGLVRGFLEYTSELESSTLRGRDRKILAKLPIEEARDLLPSAQLLGQLAAIVEQPQIERLLGRTIYHALPDGLSLEFSSVSLGMEELFALLSRHRDTLSPRVALTRSQENVREESTVERARDLFALFHAPQLGLYGERSSLRGHLDSLCKELLEIERSKPQGLLDTSAQASTEARSNFRHKILSAINLSEADSLSRIAARPQENPVTLAARMVVTVGATSNLDLIVALTGLRCSKLPQETQKWGEAIEPIFRATNSLGLPLPLLMPYSVVDNKAVTTSLALIGKGATQAREHYLESVEIPGVALKVLPLTRAPYYKSIGICISIDSEPGSVVRMLEYFEREKLRVYQNLEEVPRLTTSDTKLPQSMDYGSIFRPPRNRSGEILLSDGKLESSEHISNSNYLLRISHQEDSPLVEVDYLCAHEGALEKAKTQLIKAQRYNLSLLEAYVPQGGDITLSFSAETGVTNILGAIKTTENPAAQRDIAPWLTQLADSLEQSTLAPDFLAVLARHTHPAQAGAILEAAEVLTQIWQGVDSIATACQASLRDIVLSGRKLTVAVNHPAPQGFEVLIQPSARVSIDPPIVSETGLSLAPQTNLIGELITQISRRRSLSTGLLNLSRSVSHIDEFFFQGRIDQRTACEAIECCTKRLSKAGDITPQMAEISRFLSSLDIRTALVVAKVFGDHAPLDQIEKVRNMLLTLRAAGFASVGFGLLEPAAAGSRLLDSQTRTLNGEIITDPQFKRYLLTDVPVNSFLPEEGELREVAERSSYLVDVSWSSPGGALVPKIDRIYINESTNLPSLALALFSLHQSALNNFLRSDLNQQQLLEGLVKTSNNSSQISSFLPGDLFTANFNGFPEHSGAIWITDGRGSVHKNDLGHHQALIEMNSFGLLLMRHPFSPLARIVRGYQRFSSSTPSPHSAINLTPICKAALQVLKYNSDQAHLLASPIRSQRQDG